MAAFSFDGVLEPRPDGRLAVVLPAESVNFFGTRRQIRVHATIEGEAFDTLVLPTGDGRHFMYVAASVRRRLGVERGDSVHAAVEARSATPELPMPDELRRKLAASSAAEGAWGSLTDGMRRTARRFINGAKDPDVRAWRVHDVLRRAERYRSGAGPFYPTREDQPLLRRPRRR